jgi:hypothetical protein
MVSGFTPMELNLKRDFQFAGKEYSPLRQDSKTSATRVIRAADSTADEMRQAWSTYLDNLYREQGKLYGDIQAARTLGLSDASIRRQLVEDAELGSEEVSSIMRGKFYPKDVSEEFYASIRSQELRNQINRKTPVREIPFRDFRAMTRARARDPLIAPEKTSTPVQTRAPDLGPFADMPSEAPAQTAAPDLGPFADMPMAAPAIPTAPKLPSAPLSPQNRAALSPSLLGSDPISQQLNLEIAQRTQP